MYAKMGMGIAKSAKKEEKAEIKNAKRMENAEIKNAKQFLHNIRLILLTVCGMQVKRCL